MNPNYFILPRLNDIHFEISKERIFFRFSISINNVFYLYLQTHFYYKIKSLQNQQLN